MKRYSKPTGLTYKEINPFNPSYPKRLHLFTKHKWIYYTPRTFDISKYRTDLVWKEIPSFLYQKQKDAIKELLKYNYWMLLSWVWSWKSYMMAAIAKMYDWYTLVIAPKKEIAKGLYEKFKSLNLDVEIFDPKKFDINNSSKILIIISKSFNKYREELKLDMIYKQVLIDEIHMEFTPKRIDFFCRYKYDYIYWFTGTPELNNFPSEALFKIFNNISVDSWIRPKKPEVYIAQYDWAFRWADWHDLIQQMYWDEDRLSSFIAMVAEVMQEPDRHMWIVFVDRKDIAEGIVYWLNLLWVPASAYTWKLSTKKRQEVLDDLTKKRGVMVATYQTVWTWFDHPPLDTAFYFMFVKFKAQVKQALGRILRGSENPKYFDFQDMNLYNQRFERVKAYREMWWNIQFKHYELKTTRFSLKIKDHFEEILKFKKKEEDIDFLDI